MEREPTLADLSNEQTESSIPSGGGQRLQLLPFAMQLQNIFPVEIIARRFPVEKLVDMNDAVMSTAHTQLNLSDLGINPETLQAQIHLEVKIEFLQEPRLFEIYFKLAGIFNYTQEYNPEQVRLFLQQGSLSVMLPSAREMLLSLCTRLQVPAIVLPLIQLAPPVAPNAEQANGVNE